MSILKIANEAQGLHDQEVSRSNAGLLGTVGLSSALGSAFGIGKSTNGKRIGYSKTKGLMGAIGGGAAGTGSHIVSEARKNKRKKQVAEEENNLL